MKKLILFLCFIFIVPSASAKPNAFCMQSSVGGQITLTPALMEDNRKVAIATDGKGGVLYGWWQMIGERTLMIQWEGGSHSVFDLLQFKPCKF